jgi:cell division protein FtsI/penicillin-binding protein 2
MTWFAPLLLWAPTLFDQSVVRILTRNFPQAQFLLIDVASKEVLGRRWVSEQPAPMGSLMKPFTALAFGLGAGQAHCNPKHCWLATGHNDIDLIRAISESCNSYFLQKAAGISADRMASVSAEFHLPLPLDSRPETLIGLGSSWKVLPQHLALAYATLVSRRDAGPILEGMRRSAQSGTAKLLGGGALAKTGTAPCSHTHKAPGDGYVAILYPMDAPKYMLLVQVHGVSGAEATRTAATMLDVLRHGN